MLSNYFGDRAFLKKVLSFTLPIIIQNFITNFVSLLDNIMVGQVGTLQMSGVSVANQLVMVFNLCIFGATSGAGIFTAQFFGAGDREQLRYTVRYKLILCLLLCIGAIALFIPFGPNLIRLYLTGEGDPADAVLTLQYGYDYLSVILWGFMPFAVSSSYASSMRECGESSPQMLSSICAVIVNLCLNAILIFGLFGAPALGAVGAAVATVIARYVEMCILIIWAHTHPDRCPFAKGLYHSARIPLQLAGQIITKGTPLLVNEFLWSSGMAFLSQCFSTCGLDVVPALNISDIINNLASVVAIAIANTVGVFMGHMMGGDAPKEEILQTNRKLLRLSLLFGVVFGVLLAVIAPFFPFLYNTTAQVRTLATSLIFVLAAVKPIMAYLISVYYTIRSSGKTITAFFYDCGFMWAVSIPVAYCLSRFTALPIIPLYAICQSVDLIKVFIGYSIIRRGNWVQRLTAPK